MSVLITGGAGYIGSHAAHLLVERGEKVVVVDNLSTGTGALVPQDATFIRGDIGDQELIRLTVQEHGVDAVMHFAGSIVVPQSIEAPLQYYRNNTVHSQSLIQTCVNARVKNFIFSSTAAVYGANGKRPVTEDDPTEPTNPYARSKLMTEWILEDVARAEDFRYIALRYFNVAGADPKGRTGQSNPDATHLVKRACLAVLGRSDGIDIFGTDYDTPDGTGVRDYIHVSDLTNAHLLALDHLRAGGTSGTYNCGYGRGFSVREVISMVERMAGRPITKHEKPRRPGDSPSLIADASRLRTELSWNPNFDDLSVIVETALAWERHSVHQQVPAD
jgi:UDP-glucose 4-epimerase